jgi:putative addiction module killer protein
VIEIVRYRQVSGDYPFDTWFLGLRDAKAKARILSRMRQAEEGNFGDCSTVGEGVLELRIHVGAGFRVYYGRHGETLVVLLSGGDKASQSRDIARAKEFWADWKRRQRQ